MRNISASRVFTRTIDFKIIDIKDDFRVDIENLDQNSQIEITILISKFTRILNYCSKTNLIYKKIKHMGLKWVPLR